jgi:pimeloyl-ACP methyl ester carboxylesterase
VFSILIRARNEASWIGRTLESVLGQEASDVEVLLIDSGSEDETVAIARRYPVRVLCIPRESFSYGRALNIGAESARGEWIVPLSAHAVPADRHWLSRLRRALDDCSVAGAASRQRAHPGTRLDGYRAFWQGLYALGVHTSSAERYLFSNAASIVRADLWRTYPFDEDLIYCEDHSWALWMQKLGYKIRYVPDSVVLHSHKMERGERVLRERWELAGLSHVYGWGQGQLPRAKPRRQLRAAGLLAHYRRRERRPGPGGIRRSAGDGASYDLYGPDARARRTVVLIYGLTLAGEHDPRVVAFAQALSDSGLRAAVPVLPGLKSLRFAPEDLTAVEGLVAALTAQFAEPVAIVAFSAGAAIALAAASNPASRSAIGPILLLGPACDLELLWKGFWDNCRRRPVTAKEWDHAIYVRAALAYRCRESLDFSPQEERELAEFLGTYCRQPSLEIKREFYERVVRNRQDRALELQTLERGVLALLSMENVARVRSRVLIIHDPFDHVVPSHHAKHVFRRLQAREDSGGERLVMTSFLAHASERAGWGLGEVPSGLAALDVIGELFERSGEL